MDFCIGTPVYWLLGFGLMFASGGSLIGGLDPMVQGTTPPSCRRACPCSPI